jgi:hypothetical protein
MHETEPEVTDPSVPQVPSDSGPQIPPP